MKSKIQSSKPDIASNSPLKPKSFPVNLSMFQTSYTSSSSKTYSPLQSVNEGQKRGTKMNNMEPNLFQYNDRTPLFFSSDEDEPSFNYYNQMQESKKDSILNATKGNKLDKSQENSVQQKYTEQVKEVKEFKEEISKEEDQKMDEKIEEVIINKIYINKSVGQFSNPKLQHPTKQVIQSSKYKLNPTHSQKIAKQQDEGVKQKSQILSKTDQIIEHVSSKQHQNILIEQSSNKSSSQHSQYLPPPQVEMNRLSNQSVMQPQRKRRNRIFDNSSKNRSNRSFYVTPQKGIQTQPIQKEVQQFNYSPQIKALDVLSKIVDQINPNPRPQFNTLDWFQPFVDELQNAMKAFRNIKSIEQIDQHHQQQIRSTSQKLKEVRVKLTKRSNQTKYHSQLDQSILSNFKQLTQQIESIQQVILNSIETKYRLNQLLQSSKGLLIMLQKKQLKKIYLILQQTNIQIQRLKQIRSTCGKHKLQKIFREFLQAEINQLQDMQNSMSESFKDVFPNVKL